MEAVTNVSLVKNKTDRPSNPMNILKDALDIVNQKIEETVVFLGQPGHEEGDPFDIKNLCELALKNGKRIGDINVVVYRQGTYDYVKKERIIERFCSPEELAKLIETMVHEHTTTSNGILETASGTQFDVTQLKQNILNIDPQGYFRLNKLRLWSIVYEDREGPLMAEKLRGNTILSFKELKERVFIIDKSDPAPDFYIDISKKFHSSQGEDFYLFCRETKTSSNSPVTKPTVSEKEEKNSSL